MPRISTESSDKRTSACEAGELLLGQEVNIASDPPRLISIQVGSERLGFESSIEAAGEVRLEDFDALLAEQSLSTGHTAGVRSQLTSGPR